MRRRLLIAIIVPILFGPHRSAAEEPSVPLDAAFWATWNDGQAEISAYDLKYPRYGEIRRGTAVTIFVKEDFSLSRRVKVDRVDPSRDVVPVMKLNLVVDFPTGVYDYNLMSSSFVALGATHRPLGTPLKVSFTSQEWCGHVFQQLLPDADAIRFEHRSYFDGEADQNVQLDYPANGMLEDVVLQWARGFAAPFLQPNQTTNVPLLTASDTVRLGHKKAEWRQATLTRAGKTEHKTVPFGDIEVEQRTVEVPGHRSWVFWVEAAAPHRLILWSTSDGQRGELVKSERLKYWQVNRVDQEGAVQRLGLTPRPARTM